MISIIMPLYNAERFLKETLQSINNQKYTNYELICIDDCSIDGTAKIISEEMEKDKRIISIHNDVRIGAASSRNKGIKIAQGDYLCFLDGDDIFDEEMLESAYICAKKNRLDIVIFEYLSVVSEKIYEKKKIYRSDKFMKKFCTKPFNLYDIEPLDYVQWPYALSNKLFKKEFIRKHDIKFQSLPSCNDVYFVEMSYIMAERIMFLNDSKVMVYIRNHFTPSRISFDRDPMCAYSAYEKVLESLSEKKIDEKFYEYCYLRMYQCFTAEITSVKKEEKKEKFYEFLHNSGIKKLIKSEEKLCDKYFYKYLFQFVKQEYESKWFENENVITIVLRSNQNAIWELWNQYKNIGIWGIGRYGKSLLKLILEKNLDVCCLIDGNPEKKGLEIENHFIKKPNEVKFENIDLIIIAIRGEYQNIENYLEQYDLEVTHIKKYL